MNALAQRKFFTTWWVLKFVYGMFFLVWGLSDLMYAAAGDIVYDNISPWVLKFIAIEAAMSYTVFAVIHMSMALLVLLPWTTRFGAYLGTLVFGLTIANMIYVGAAITSLPVLLTFMLMVGAWTLGRLTTIGLISTK